MCSYGVVVFRHIGYSVWALCINPNCTGLFRSMIIRGGGGGPLRPPSDLGPKGADRREIWHAPQKLCKEKDLGLIFLKNGIFY